MTAPIVILAGGGTALPHSPLPEPRLVIAADSGLHLAEPLGLSVDLVVGDLDSADPNAVDRAIATGAEVIRHDTDKDATDLDLALAEARERGGGRVLVVGGVEGDRFDHLLAAAELLGSDRYADLDIEWWSEAVTVFVTRDVRTIDGEPGDLLSIIPVSMPVTVSVSGVRWPLDGVTLAHGSTRGVSNEITTAPAEITVSSGTAFVVHTRRD
ncbi:MAG TPA: thiamine diphosphokinase [Acidimicrobiia bacterium]|nr:thiamine diphosphokinase [Acidimicrobiia bacterium]